MFCDVWIEGRSPLLMNKYHEHVSLENEAGKEQARRTAHTNASGHLQLPSVALWLLLRDVGKETGVVISPHRVTVVHEWVPLLSPDLNTPLSDFSVDVRAVRSARTARRELRYRARVDEWAAAFRLRVNERLILPSVIKRVLSEGGEANGLGDYRPQRGGLFGRFGVRGWSETPEGSAQPTTWMETV
jgi:hypothetical protein